MKAVVVFSGGMDSTTLIYDLLDRDYTELSCVSFDYGQRHRKELDHALAITKQVPQVKDHRLVDLKSLTALLGGSALTDPDIDVPHGHYAEETMRQTVVPNRNAIMMSIAWGWASHLDYDAVATAVHAGDHFIYPDCRPDFVKQLTLAFRLGTEGHRKENLTIETPFVNWSKTEIAKRGGELHVPYELTWTCYEGGDKHCGLCGACQERKEAFRDSGVPDPTIYLK